MELIFFWLIFAILVGMLAGKRGRSGFGWFLVAAVISPLLAVLLLLVLADRTAQTSTAAVDAPTPETHVRCPDCRELVRFDARKCKHCGAALVPQPAGPPDRGVAYEMSAEVGERVGKYMASRQTAESDSLPSAPGRQQRSPVFGNVLILLTVVFVGWLFYRLSR